MHILPVIELEQVGEHQQHTEEANHEQPQRLAETSGRIRRPDEEGDEVGNRFVVLLGGELARLGQRQLQRLNAQSFFYIVWYSDIG